ncbi:MAG: hypothetical protein RL291_1955 [Pseudomonadota bacterium]|jgi:hypothetical protein
MTQLAPKSWPQRLRSFAAFPMPFLLLLIAISFVAKEMTEPAFVTGWPVEAKALALFATVTLLPLVLDLWSKWIDPQGYGAHRRPLSSFFDNMSGHAAMAAVVVLIAYGKQLTNLSTWWIGLGILIAGALPIIVSMVRTLRNNGTRP